MHDVVVVAGASGTLGREICAELKRRGRRVIGLVRAPERARRFNLACDELRVGDALQPSTLVGKLAGATAVISTLGASVKATLTGRRPYSQVDVPMNRALIDRAIEEEVGKFVYVSVLGAQALPQLDYFAAHGAVENILSASGLPHTILRPTGFFDAMGDLFDVAARFGILPRFGDGAARSNPIHEVDLAGFCVDALDQTEIVREVGGPDVLSRAEISRLAFAALGRRPRALPVSPALARMNAALLRPFHPRLAEMMRFIVHVMTNDTMAPQVGTRRLASYFQERAARHRSASW